MFIRISDSEHPAMGNAIQLQYINLINTLYI